MRILHLLSQTELTGVESYVLELSARQRAQGHEVWIVSDHWHLQDPGVPVLKLPISKRNWIQRIRNVRNLRKILREHGIHVVHAHSRASQWVGFWASRRFCPQVSTLHGNAHRGTSAKWVDVIGEAAIAICENVRTQYQTDLGTPASKIEVIRNPVAPLKLAPAPARKPARFALIGRLSGPKGVRAIAFIERTWRAYRAQNPEATLAVAGGLRNHLSTEDHRKLERLLQDAGLGVTLLEGPQDFRTLFSEVDGVIGAGRVAALASIEGLPTWALGEWSEPGWITDLSLDSALASNFGDLSNSFASVGRSEMVEHPDFLTPVAPSAAASRRVRAEFDSDSVAKQVHHLYRKVRLSWSGHHWIPVLMYHQVTEAPLGTRHRIFVTRERFESQLRTLHHWRRTVITFSDLEDAIQGRRSFCSLGRRPVILTFDDGYQNNLRLAAPVLKKFGMRAVLYLLGPELKANHWDEGEVPTSPLLSPTERKESVSQFEIGSHTCTHDKLTALTPAQADATLSKSFTDLKSEFGQAPLSVAYPYGDRTTLHEALARGAGFLFAVNTDRGGLTTAENLWNLFRVSVFPEDGAWAMIKKTHPLYRRYYFWRRGQ